MVSVIIPTYNRFELVQRAINSVLNQTYTDFEIIVINDCSDDIRYDELEKRNDIRYFKLTKRSGLPAIVRNFGIRQSLGDWIAFLDDDDTWKSEKLEKQMSLTDKYKFICTESYYENQLYAKGKYLNIWNQKNPENIYEFNYDLLLKHNLIINSSVLVYKDLLNEVNLISESNHLRGIEDYDTWLKITKLGYVCYFIDEPLLDYELNSYKSYKDDYITQY
jgi:glycosyltransferase involved in cell wall biosynthesis